MPLHVQSPWDDFPATYRQREISQIAGWIAAGDSGLVVGLAGSGKSNVMGYVAHRLETAGPVLRPRLDLNRLPEPTPTAFLRQLLVGLEDAAKQMPPEAHERLAATVEKGLAQSDSFLLRRSIQAALAILCGELGIRTMILVDRFDVALERFPVEFYNNLRAWRDDHKARLTYLVSARRDWPDWPNLGELSEFTDLIAGRTCWVGALGRDDVRWNLERYGKGRPSKQVVDQMMALSGGHAGLLKALWAAGAAREKRPAEEWARQDGVRRQCQELWDDLPATIQEAARSWQSGGTERQVGVKSFLLNTGLAAETQTGLQLASLVWSGFVHEQSSAARDVLWRDAATGEVYRGSVRLTVALTPQEDRMLVYLLAHPGEVCDKDALVEAVWPEDVRVEGVRDDRLAQLVRRLRDKVEPDPHVPRYIVPVWGRGYRLLADGSGG